MRVFKKMMPGRRTFEITGISEKQMWILAALTGRCGASSKFYRLLANAGFRNFDSDNIRVNPIKIHVNPYGDFIVKKQNERRKS
jgi:hypothetical protein